MNKPQSWPLEISILRAFVSQNGGDPSDMLEDGDPMRPVYEEAHVLLDRLGAHPRQTRTNNADCIAEATTPIGAEEKVNARMRELSDALRAMQTNSPRSYQPVRPEPSDAPDLVEALRQAIESLSHCVDDLKRAGLSEAAEASIADMVHFRAILTKYADR